MIEATFVLTNSLGLHARPAAEMTITASKFKSKITLKGNGKVADAKSIIMVMSMGVKKGHELTIQAEGPDETECLEALTALIENNFFEK
ncbi:MAG: HPr family phosphocarrier protein [Clostridiaceae bacterium]|nr:HPr family phosphocarrier protein [Clostridiaceae bacterium]